MSLTFCLAVLELVSSENWRLQTKEQDYSKTHLPDMFETQISEALPVMRQILDCSFPKEADLFANERLRPILLQSFQKLVGSFKETLACLVRLGAVLSAPTRPTDLALDGGKTGTTAPVPVPVPVPIKDKKLLIALSNCDYALRFSLDAILQRLAADGVRHVDRIREVRTLRRQFCDHFLLVYFGFASF